MKYFRATYVNGYCGCDDYIYIAAETLADAEDYASENIAEEYVFYDDWSQCLDEPEDYESEDEYLEAVEEYQAECCVREVVEISEEEYNKYKGL
jgi:hypothetical protein